MFLKVYSIHFLKNLKNDVLKDIQKNVNIDLELNSCSNYECTSYINQIVQGTNLDATQLDWRPRLVQNSIGRLPNTHGNSILEKFINVVILIIIMVLQKHVNFYLPRTFNSFMT